MWFQRIRGKIIGSGWPALDVLMANADPSQPLSERVAWAQDLMSWLRRESPTSRLRLLFQILERQPDVHLRVARTLRSIINDTEAVDLFADTGLPTGSGFLHELTSRFTSNILPDPPETHDLADIIDRLFPNARIGDWLEELTPDLAAGIVGLFHYEETSEEKCWMLLRVDMEDAMIQLADRICVVGSNRDIRTRMSKMAFRELPFQKLAPMVETLILRHRVKPEELAAELNLVRGMAEACYRTLDEVVGCLEKTGVSMTLVYDIERLRAQIHRLELLIEAWSTPALEDGRKIAMVADLIRQNHARRSARELCRQNLQLLTQRIVERNAETGEHYVARNGREYLTMFRSASGGGAIMGITTVIKLFLAKLVLAEFFQGAFFGLNYAISFVLIQLMGFTVATKQPATTAPALARRMEELRSTPQLEALVDEVVFLIRSQIAAVFGNLLLVIPVTLLLDQIWMFFRGHHIVDHHKADLILGTVLPWSGCWFYAAFTGVLLWLSSLFAAWADNWFVLHQLGPALMQHRRLQKLLGPTRIRNWALWLKQNVAGLAGNISLGLMLGIVPSIAIFFGLPLDVRHVTLSTGQVTAAFAALGLPALWKLSTLWISAGIIGIGLLNIVISFMLAIWVAIRARNVHVPERRLFYAALLKRATQSPLSFLLPLKTDK